MNRVVCRKERSLKTLGSSRAEYPGAGITSGLPRPGTWQGPAVVPTPGMARAGDTRLRTSPDSGSAVR